MAYPESLGKRELCEHKSLLFRKPANSNAPRVEATAQIDPDTDGQLMAETDNAGQLVLPYLATAGDLREVVQFLKRRPEGASIAEAMDAARKRLFDPRKVFAYEFWGIVKREDDRLKLSQLGWAFARQLAPEAEAYRSVIARTAVYDSALVWIYEQGHQLVTHLDMQVAWSENAARLEIEDIERLEAYASSFFQICHAADLGMLTVGRKGQPTRLRIYPEELQNYIKLTAHEKESPTQGGALQDYQAVLRQPLGKVKPSDASRVFISWGDDTNTVERVLEMLALSGLDYEIIERTPTQQSLISDNAFQGMRRCNLGVFLLNEADFRKNDVDAPNDQLLTELAAAFVHFDRRVILLVNGKSPLPAGFQGLHTFRYEAELSWEVAVQVTKLVKHLSQ